MSHPCKKVLLIDDSPEFQDYMSDLFSESSCDFLGAQESKLGYLMAQNYQADLILLDVFMPEPNGLKLLESLKKNPLTQHTPVIMLSGCSEAGAVKQSLAQGAAGYILKPFQLPFLISELEKHLGVVLFPDVRH
ncbi:MAG: PleD family two-component system response regulator [Candidatus Sericytochromatia bacterium]